MSFTKMKLSGRNALVPGVLDRFARFVFEPTGYFVIIRKQIEREARDLMQRAQFNPTYLPG